MSDEGGISPEEVRAIIGEHMGDAGNRADELERLLRDFAPLIVSCKRDTLRSDEHEYLDELEQRRLRCLEMFA